MHKGRRWVFHRREVDVARRLAPRTLDLQPGKAAVNGLINRRGRIDRLAVGPHPFVPAFTEQPIGLLDQCFALGPHFGRLRCQDVGHRSRLAELLVQSLAVTSGEGRRVVLRRHPGIHDSDNADRRGGRRLLERRPAAVLFVAAGASLTGIFQQPLSDTFPDSLGAGQPDGIGCLDLDGAAAAVTGNAQHMLPDVAEPLLLDRAAGWSCVGDSVSKDGLPVVRRHLVGRTDGTRRAGLPADGGGQLCHLFGRRHAPAGGSVGHSRIEHNKNIRVES
jgi:hypothetical protein